MSKRIGVFADITNMYYCVGKKFSNQKLNYRAWLDYVKDLGDVQCMTAYGLQDERLANPFIYALKQLGFHTKYKEPKNIRVNWNVGMAMDIVTMHDRLDVIFLGSADANLAPAVEWAVSKGVEVVIFACGISRDLKQAASRWIEIPESLLEKKNEATNNPTRDS